MGTFFIVATILIVVIIFLSAGKSEFKMKSTREFQDKTKLISRAEQCIEQSERLLKDIQSENEEIFSSQDGKEKFNDSNLPFPDFPEKLEIGKQVANWFGDAVIEGYYDLSENVVTEVPNDKVDVIIHTNGIKIRNSNKEYQIHNSQLRMLIPTNRFELEKIDKQFCGTSKKINPLSVINSYYLVFDYWDIKSKEAQTLFFSIYDNKKLILFLNRHQKERVDYLNLD
jgi:hypothetical protein